MATEKITATILLLFASLYSSEALQHEPWPPLNELTRTNDDYCLCFAKTLGQVLVPQLLDINKHGTERLVVYIYKDPITQEVTMYTPNTNKQHNIPDLPYEDGDILQVITIEPLLDLLYSNPNVIKRNPSKVPDAKLKPVNRPDAQIKATETNGSISQNVPDTVRPVEVPANIHYDHISIPPPDKIEGILVHQDKLNVTGGSSMPQPWQPDTGFKVNGSIYDYHGNVHDFVTFDKWFQVQMTIFQKMDRPMHANNINIVTLKAVIENTLKENQIYVSSNGLLVDATGSALDISHLSLRPILIGNQLAYQNILQNSKEFILPKNSPYLEALLISLTKPPRVLGIIPLGIVVLPPVASHGSVTTIHHVNTPAIHHISSSGANAVQNTLGTKLQNTIIGQTIKAAGRRIVPGHLESQQLWKHLPRGDLTKRRSHNRHSFRRSHHENDLMESNLRSGDEADEEKDDKKFSHVRNILQKVYRIITPLGMMRGSSSERSNSIGDSDDDVYYSDEDSEPDFRIIGGNAATGSGTPVSNRGRNGADYI